jgi:hypothetical protein
MQRRSNSPRPSPLLTFAPSRRALAVIVPLAGAALGLALYLRYGIIQNGPIGIACDAGEQSSTCTVRATLIGLFVRGVFGWTALVAALFQLWRPNRFAFGIGLIAACLGLVLYNTRLSALAVALLVLSLARALPVARAKSGAS